MGVFVELACIASAAYVLVSPDRRNVSDILMFIAAVVVCALVYHMIVRLLTPIPAPSGDQEMVNVP